MINRSPNAEHLSVLHSDTIPEFQPFYDALAQEDREAPAVPVDVLRTCAAAGEAGVRDLREFAKAHYAETAGALDAVFASLLTQIPTIREGIQAEGKALRAWLKTIPAEVTGRKEDSLPWSMSALVKLAMAICVCFGLLGVEWITFSATLIATGYEVFEDAMVRETFALFPALGLAYGWKSLANLQPNAVAKFHFWRRLSRMGLAFGVLWAVGCGIAFGPAAWDDGAGGLGLGASTGWSWGITLFISGTIAGSMLSASAWLFVERELECHSKTELVPNERYERVQGRSRVVGCRDVEAVKIAGDLKARVKSIRDGSDVYEERAVMALRPRWVAPDDSALRSSLPPIDQRPGVPDSFRNGKSTAQEISE